MKEAEAQAGLSEISQNRSQRVDFCAVAHVCKSGHWEYIRALLRPILMMRSEAVKEEIGFSQIEEPS